MSFTAHEANGSTRAMLRAGQTCAFDMNSFQAAHAFEPMAHFHTCQRSKPVQAWILVEHAL